ncbi:hypothetical protein [Lacinutrix jangbogonensis]|uniref:hypothetical protein n=1 Tax=Lacinutrix jangbogonensis TaxID=1469557 RepID=UPI00053D62FC|nr:hypothetical protein [Lacinutrix jangbogonensis]
MKLYKTLAFLLVFVVMLASFTHCKSSNEVSNSKNNNQILKLEDKTSFILGNAYFQSWVAGVRGGGSGIHLYISVLSNKNSVAFDSVYFRDMKSKMQLDKKSYIASFKTAANQQDSIVFSNNIKAEDVNQLLKSNFPFNLKDNECVISYIENGTAKYLLLENLTEKRRIEYPSARPKH